MRSATCGSVRGTGATALPRIVSIVTARLRADGPNPLAGPSEDAPLTVDLQSQAGARADIGEREPAVAGGAESSATMSRAHRSTSFIW
jgi:hypothetical protein